MRVIHGKHPKNDTTHTNAFKNPSTLRSLIVTIIYYDNYEESLVLELQSLPVVNYHSSTTLIIAQELQHNYNRTRKRHCKILDHVLFFLLTPLFSEFPVYKVTFTLQYCLYTLTVHVFAIILPPTAHTPLKSLKLTVRNGHARSTLARYLLAPVSIHTYIQCLMIKLITISKNIYRYA